MKNLLLKIPLPVLYAAVFGALAYFVFCKFIAETAPSSMLLEGLIYLSTITMLMWYLGVNSFFSYEGNSKKDSITINVLMLSSFGSGEIINFLPIETYWLYIIPMALYISFIILLASKISSVFYARSKWFVYLELLLPIVGVVTLTPEMKRWVESDEARKND